MTKAHCNWIRVYDDAISPEFCAKSIDFFERSPARHKLNQPWQRYHQLVRLHETPLYAQVRSSVADVFDRYKSDIGCGTLNYVDRIETPSMSRYDVADDEGAHRFHSHADAWSMETASRQVSVIVYLNDVTDGGATIFDEGTVVQPQTGRVLVFPSSLCFQHRGDPPASNAKYVLVSWLHFRGTGHSYTTLPLKP